MHIYTRKGDRGRTVLASGQPVSKSHQLIEVVGALDELNAALGLLLAASGETRAKTADAIDQSLLSQAQTNLFFFGAVVAQARPEVIESIKHQFSATQTLTMESRIDQLSAKLPPLRNFVLPGGSELSARAHWARACCRRAERLVIAAAPDHETAVATPLTTDAPSQLWNDIKQYLNRLSDYLFILARVFNQKSDQAEQIWQGSQ